MVHIEHVALWAQDIELLCAFYAQFFGATPGDLYENPRKGFTSRFVTFASGARLEVMASSTLRPEVNPPDNHRLGYTHLALSVGSEAAVDALAERLRSSGVIILDGPRRTGDGYYECVILDPEGNRVELTA